MTKKEALRKIDRLVVERIFELTVTEEKRGRKSYTYVKQEDCENKDQFYKINNVLLTDYGWMTDEANIAYFSSNIESAFYLVDKLRKLDNCCIKMNLDVPGDVWRVEIKGNHYNCEKKGLADGRSSLPLQICLAGLLSVGVQREELKDILEAVKDW